MATVFYTGSTQSLVKTKDQKKMTSIANRVPKHVRDSRKSSPVTVTTFRKD